MSLPSLASLLIQETKERLYAKALEIAVAVGLPVTSWGDGDPTRSLYHILTDKLSVIEGIRKAYIAAGFLDFAVEYAEETGDTRWLKITAKQIFNVDVTEATAASTTVTLTNGGGGEFTIEPGALTLKNSTTGATYTNTTGGTLLSGPGTTLDVDVVANEAGSASSASALEIDELVTTLLEVTCSNATAAVGIDEESPQNVAARCRAKTGVLSPNGPRDAYVYVAQTPEMTGTTGVTRARSIGDSDTGDVALYIAGPSGAVSSDDRDAVETAILAHATPLCITPDVDSATGVTIDVTYQLWLYSSVGLTENEVLEEVEDELERMFAARPIGGDVIANQPGRIYHSMIESTIRNTPKIRDHAFRVSLTAPAGDTDLQLDQIAGEVAVLGAVTGTITFVEPA